MGIGGKTYFFSLNCVLHQQALCKKYEDDSRVDNVVKTMNLFVQVLFYGRCWWGRGAVLRPLQTAVQRATKMNSYNAQNVCALQILKY
jgi:hypothetical protein